MLEKNLELRMYFFVPYQLTGIQQGIQCGHAAIEYMMKFWKELDCIDFRENWKTWVILNGGTTNSRNQEVISEVDSDCKPIGTLNQIHEELWLHSVNHALFYEPDLQDALTAICFILDERVFNRKKYPNFNSYIIASIEDLEYAEIYKKIDQAVYTMDYDKWVEYVGGEKNVFLRNLIEGKRLA